MPTDPTDNVVEEIMACRCPQTPECRYAALNSISQKFKRCFSCRKDVHAGHGKPK